MVHGWDSLSTTSDETQRKKILDATCTTSTGGLIVGTTDTQTLTGKTVTAPIYDSFTEYNTISAPSSPAASKARVYAKQVDANNDALFIKQKVAGAVVEVQIS